MCQVWVRGRSLERECRRHRGRAARRDGPANAAYAGRRGGWQTTPVRPSRRRTDDLVTLSPLDVETILESVKKTGRCVVVQESRRTLGLGSELSALLNEYALDRLKAPVKRASGYDVHFPANDIEDDYLTDAARAEHAIEAVMSYEF